MNQTRFPFSNLHPAASDLQAIEHHEREREAARHARRPMTTAAALAPAAPPVFIALSGGGFRATLSALGALRLLADIGVLGRVETSSSVSGGSIAAGLFARHWKALAVEGFSREAFDRIVIVPFVDRVSRHSLQNTLYRNIWRTWGPPTFTDMLVKLLNDWCYGGTKLEELPSADRGECRFIFNAADMRRGRRFAFEQNEIGEWGEPRQSTSGTGIQLAQAVAASCSVPGVFPPLKLRAAHFASGWEPCLADGGVYDTLALDPVDRYDEHQTGRYLVSVGAGGLYHGGSVPKMVSRVFSILRAGEMSLGQVTAQRSKVLGERFVDYHGWRAANSTDAPPRWTRRGVHFELASRVAAPEEWLSGRPELPPWAPQVTAEEWGERMADVPTSLKRMDVELCRSLIYRSWWLTGATLATYHPELLPPDRYPAWTELSAG